jgi:hypothetical protein
MACAVLHQCAVKACQLLAAAMLAPILNCCAILQSAEQNMLQPGCNTIYIRGDTNVQGKFCQSSPQLRQRL